MTEQLTALPETAALLRPAVVYTGLVELGLLPGWAYEFIKHTLTLPEHTEVTRDLARYPDGQAALARLTDEWAAAGWPAPWPGAGQ